MKFCYPDMENGKTDSSRSQEELLGSSILVLGVEKGADKQLDALSNAYVPDREYEKTAMTKVSMSKGFILIEFHEEEDLRTLLSCMEKDSYLNELVATGFMTIDDKSAFLQSFISHDERPPPRKTRSSAHISYLRPVKEEEVVLNFPFDVTYAELDHLTEGLNEANGILPFENGKMKKVSDETAAKTGEEKFVNVWKHSHIIRGEDYERLSPGEYLNDALIDLWMTW